MKTENDEKYEKYVQRRRYRVEDFATLVKKMKLKLQFCPSLKKIEKNQKNTVGLRTP